MKLAARAARRQRQKELTDGVRTRKLGPVKYEEPSVDLKLSSEQVNCLRQLTVMSRCLLLCREVAFCTFIFFLSSVTLLRLLQTRSASDGL